MHKKIVFAFIVLLKLLDFSKAENLENVIVETKYGKIEGDVVKVKDSDFVAAVFKGIPYGSAKRFAKPEPPTPWTDIKKTKKFGDRCFQHLIFGADVKSLETENEQCLHLNVFGPLDKKGQKLPVMVYIHGGGFAIGSSTESGQAGIVEWLLPKGVVVVTINYRLGPWGFFSSGTTDAPGNYGLWDQTLALRWVKENIDRFGGDPNKVTVFGESAGAISVSMLTISPHSRDLFQQAILMSGTTFMPWFGIERGYALEASDRLAISLGCGPTTGPQNANTKIIVDCVKAKSTQELLKGIHSYKPFETFEFVGFVPVFDGDFFPEPIEKLHQSAPPKPTIIGTTSDEMVFFATPIIPLNFEWIVDSNNFTIDKLIQILNVLFPDRIYQQATPLVRQLALHHYVDSRGDRTNSSFLVEQYKELLNDFMFIAPAYKEAILRYKRGSTVWLYSFDYYDDAIFSKDRKSKGAPHYMEMAYLFKFEGVFHQSPWQGNDLKIANMMTTMWTDFAIYGQPQSKEAELRKEFTWEPINDQYPSRYLNIGLDTKQRSQYNRRSVSFWHQLLPNVQDFVDELKHAKADSKSAKTEL